MVRTLIVAACLALLCGAATAQLALCDKNKMPQAVAQGRLIDRKMEGDRTSRAGVGGHRLRGPSSGCVDLFVLETFDESGKQISKQNIKAPLNNQPFSTTVPQTPGTTRTYKVSTLKSQNGLKSSSITVGKDVKEFQGVTTCH